MAAYSFQPIFPPLILTGAKDQTIRAWGRRRHARPDMPVQLYQGMRTRHCRLILISRCVTVLPIEIDFGFTAIQLGDDWQADRDAFARRDGFPEGFEQMEAFWEKHHPEVFKPAPEKRCPECGGWVHDVFDHVDKDCPPRPSEDGKPNGGGIFRGVLIRWRPPPGPVEEGTDLTKGAT